jgi:hypothetical protein
MLGSPVQLLSCLGYACHTGRNVSRAPIDNLEGYVLTGSSLKLLYNLKDGSRRSGAYVERFTARLRLNKLNCREVGFGKIDNVDIVTFACFIIRTKNAEPLASPARDLSYKRHEIVGCAGWIFSNISRRLRSHRVEVTQLLCHLKTGLFSVRFFRVRIPWLGEELRWWQATLNAK